MSALALIYSHRVPEFKETQIEFDPIQKRNPNPQRQQKTRLSVDRTQPRAKACQSVDWAGRPLSATVDRAVDHDDSVHVVNAGRPSGRPAFSTGRPGGRPGAQAGLLNASFLSPLIFDLCANFLYSSISSLLSKLLPSTSISKLCMYGDALVIIKVLVNTNTCIVIVVANDDIPSLANFPPFTSQ